MSALIRSLTCSLAGSSQTLYRFSMQVIGQLKLNKSIIG